MNAHTIPYELLREQVAAHPYPLLFATISGAHLYGFPSPDSDFDLRGIHRLPLEKLLGLKLTDETVTREEIRQGLEIDLVTHDLRKFLLMMLKRNGYVMEQLLSPLVVHTTDAHRQLVELAPACLTRHHAHHYLGFAETQWHLFGKENPPRVKPLLYVYRVLLTGIHLMKTGEVEANLLTLNQTAQLPYLDELVERKLSGPEKGTLSAADLAFHSDEYQRLVRALEEAAAQTHLPEQPQPGTAEALNDLLLRVRTERVG